MKKERLLLPVAGFTAALFVAVLTLNSGPGSLTVIGAGGNSANTIWGHYNRLEPTLDTPGCQEFWISCDTHDVRYSAPTSGVIEDRGTPTVEDAEAWKLIEGDRRYLPKWRVDENTISFGMYPTTKVPDDSDTFTVLSNKLSVKNPSAASHEGWNVYDYYVENVLRNGNSGIGYYQDLFVNGKNYRAVYYRLLRPFGTNSKAEAAGSHVDNNEYATTKLYFFEFTPIQWKILEEDNTSIKMMATTILDSWQYDHDTGIASWGTSDMHNFLNGTFYNSAIKYAQDKILDVEGNDKVTILSLDEAKNGDYGFTNDDSATTTRQFISSDYAKSQGNFVSGEYGDWALKTLAASGNRYTVTTEGAIESSRSVRLTHRSGILPVISLSKN